MDKYICKDVNCKLDNKRKDTGRNEDKDHPLPGRWPVLDVGALQPRRPRCCRVPVFFERLPALGNKVSQNATLRRVHES